MMTNHKILLMILIFPLVASSEFSLNISIGSCDSSPQSGESYYSLIGIHKFTDIPIKPAIVVSVNKPLGDWGGISFGLGYKEAKYSGPWELTSIGYITTPFQGEYAWIVGMNSSLRVNTLMVPISMELLPFKDSGLFLSANFQLLIVSNTRNRTNTDVVKYEDIDQYLENPSVVPTYSFETNGESSEGVIDHDLQFGYGIGWRHSFNDIVFTISGKYLNGINTITKRYEADSGLGERQDTYFEIGIGRTFKIRGT